jgi:hypothetical protein
MKTRNRTLLFCFIFFFALFISAAASAQTRQTVATPKYRDPNLSIQDRVADLLPRMSLEEKVEQIAGSRGPVHLIDPTGTFTDETGSALLRQLQNPDVSFPAKRAAILRNAVQR